jgi:hypothetical protein
MLALQHSLRNKPRQNITTPQDTHPLNNNGKSQKEIGKQ